MARDMTNAVRMLITTKAAPDGFTVIRYDKGEVYTTLPPHLVKVFIESGWAEPYTEAKMQAPVYENKMEAAAAVTKGAGDGEGKVQHTGEEEAGSVKEEVKTSRRKG